MEQAVSDIKVVCIPPHMLGEMWPHIGGWLLKGQLAITPDMHAALLELLSYLLKVHAGRALAWIAVEEHSRRILAAMLSEIIAEGSDVPGRPARKVIWVSRMGGEHILRWGHQLSETMAKYAKDEGADAVRFWGRKALLRAYTGCKIVGARDDGINLFERAA